MSDSTRAETRATARRALVLDAHKAMRCEPPPSRGGLSHTARHVLLVLCDFDLADISVRTLQDPTGLADKAVRDAITELETAEWVLVSRQNGCRNSYVLNRTKIEARADAYLRGERIPAAAPTAVNGTAVNGTAVGITAVKGTTPPRCESPGTAVIITGDRGDYHRRKPLLKPISKPQEKPQGCDADASLGADAPEPLVLVPPGSTKRAASRKPKKAAAPKHPEHARVVASYFEAFERANGCKPTFDGREGKSIQVAIEKLGADEVIRRIGVIYADGYLSGRTTINDLARDPDKFANPVRKARPILQPAAEPGESTWKENYL